MADIMNEDIAIQALDTVAELIKRAVKITDKAPYWSYVTDDGKFARLTIQGKTTTLRWPTIETEWDCSTLETEEVSFPARLLFISDVEFAAWQLEELSEYERGEAKRTRQWEQKKEAKERAEFERLKARYG